MASVEIENVDIAGNYFLAMIIIVGASALGIGFAFVLSQSLKKIKVRAVAVNEHNGSSTLHEGKFFQALMTLDESGKTHYGF